MSVLALREVSKTYGQDAVVVHALTAAENVSLPLELDGVALRRARPAGMAAVESLGMAGRVSRFPGQLASWAGRVLFLRDGRFSGQTSPPARPELLLTDPEHSR